MKCDLEDVMACSLQLWDWLEDRRGKNDEVPRRMWEVMEAKVREIQIGKIKEGREEKGGREEMREKRIEKRKRKKEKDDRS